MMKNPRKIILGVTASESLRLMNGLPEFLNSKGWEVVVVASWIEDQEPRSTSSIKYVNIKMSRTPKPLHDLLALVRWVYLISQESPQVVFTGTPKAGMLGIIAAWLNNTPSRVYHLRGLRLETSRGFSKYFFRTIERLVIALSSATLCVSKSLREKVIAEGLGNESKLVVLGKGSSNGIDIKEFEKTVSLRRQATAFSELVGIKSDVPTIGFVGRLTADKGIFDLISAHKILIENKFPNQLLLIGNTEKVDEAREIEELIKDIPSIFQPGQLQKPQIAFSLMNIFCLPTYREGFPNVVLEAGLCKLPTVTTTATGAIDSVIHSKTGLLYKTGDVAGLVASLSTLLENPELAHEYGENAFQYVSKEFNRLIVWEKIESFLTSSQISVQSRSL